MYLMYVKILVILLFAVYASIRDVKTMTVSNRLNVSFGMVGIFFIVIENRFEAIIIAIIAFYVLFLFVDFLGGGDLKFLTALTLYIGPLIVQVLGVYCFINLIKRYVLKKKGVYPAMPDITLSIIISLVLVIGGR